MSPRRRIRRQLAAVAAVATELLVPVAILLVALALVALLFWADVAAAAPATRTTPPRPAVSPLDEPGVMGRLSEAWPDITSAAARTDTDPLVLAAMAIHESRLLCIIGGYRNEQWGPLQVRWATWGQLLRARGIAAQADDLLDRRTGLLAGAVVLQEIRRRWGPGTRMGRGGESLMCAYDGGMKGLRMDRCDYSRTVLRLRDGLRRRMAGDGASASCGECAVAR